MLARYLLYGQRNAEGEWIALLLAVAQSSQTCHGEACSHCRNSEASYRLQSINRLPDGTWLDVLVCAACPDAVAVEVLGACERQAAIPIPSYASRVNGSTPPVHWLRPVGVASPLAALGVA